ncbi:MAG TPA: YggT family protein [Acidimicrobiia bacterium]|nr:YggT family protein [Acidimicrobiia bacterium]HWW45613.1 YggT family protein [Acidimicrobiia bacterium]
MGIVCDVFTVFIVILFARAVLSWFPIRPDTVTAQINRLLIDLTEWALRPLRRIIPPVGMFDLSFLVLFFVILLVRSAVLGC